MTAGARYRVVPSWAARGEGVDAQDEDEALAVARDRAMKERGRPVSIFLLDGGHCFRHVATLCIGEGFVGDEKGLASRPF